MSNEVKVINNGNAEIQHSIHTADHSILRKNCVGIMLEIIKSSAAAGTPTHLLEDMISKLDENAEIIFNAITNKK